MRKLLFEISEGYWGRTTESTMEVVGCRVKARQTKTRHHETSRPPAIA